MRAIVGSALLAATALLAGPAYAQRGAAPAATDTREYADEVVVRGRRMSDVRDELHRYVHEFVAEIARVPPGRGYARWPGRVCVGVQNLRKDPAQYIVDHISRVAADVGLRPGEPGCSPQAIIAFTTDGRALARYMVEHERRVFRPVGGLAGMNSTLDALDDFVETDRPVRWWHVSMPVDARIGTKAIRTPEDDDSPPEISVAGPSRIHSGIRDDLRYVIVIVDSTKLAGTTWEQLADYLAVVSLAQIDPKSRPTGFDTILNVFDNPAAYSGLTDWDRSYLRALYSFDQERVPRIAVNALVGEMTRQALEPTAP